MNKHYATKAAALACALGLGLSGVLPTIPALAAGGETGLYVKSTTNPDDLVTPQGTDPDDPTGEADNLKVTIPVAIHYVAQPDGSLVGPNNGSVVLSNNCSMNVHVSAIEVEDTNGELVSISEEAGTDRVFLPLTPKTYLDHEATAHMGETINLARFKGGPTAPIPGDWNILRSDADISGDPEARAKDTENKLELFGSSGSQTLDGSIGAFDKLDPSVERQFGTIHWTVMPGFAKRSARMVNGEFFATRLSGLVGGAEKIHAVVFRCLKTPPAEALSLSDGEGELVAASWDAESGTVYVDTAADTLYLPENTEGMFSGMAQLTQVVLDGGSKGLLDYPETFDDLVDGSYVEYPGCARHTVTFAAGKDGATGSTEAKSVIDGLSVTLPESGYSYEGAVSLGWLVDGNLMKPGDTFVPTSDVQVKESVVNLVEAPVHDHLADYSAAELSSASRRMEQLFAADDEELLANDEVYQAFHQFLLNGEAWCSEPCTDFASGTNASNKTCIKANLVGILHDDKADGTGKVGLSFVSSGILTVSGTNNYSPRLQDESTNRAPGGWKSAKIRAGLLNAPNGYIWQKLPDSLRDVIVPVKKLTNNKGVTNKVSDVTTTDDYLWLLSVAEIFGDCSTVSSTKGYNAQVANVILAEGTQYEYYKDVLGVKPAASGGYYEPANKIIQQFGTWWNGLRTPWPGSEEVGGYWLCLNMGSDQPKPVPMLGSGQCAITPGFCI